MKGEVRVTRRAAARIARAGDYEARVLAMVARHMDTVSRAPADAAVCSVHPSCDPMAGALWAESEGDHTRVRISAPVEDSRVNSNVRN